MPLNWPISLSDISLENMNMTELWFLRNTIDSNNYTVLAIDDPRIKRLTPKFGYNQCHIFVEDQGYLIKHKNWISSEDFIVFHVSKL